jgi:hypothetical protein
MLNALLHRGPDDNRVETVHAAHPPCCLWTNLLNWKHGFMNAEDLRAH